MSDVNYQKILDRIFLVSEKLIVFDGLEDVYEHIIKTAIILTNAEAATIRVFNMQKGTLDMVKGYALSTGFFTQPAIRIGEGITGRVVLDGKPFSAIDVTRVQGRINKELVKLDNVRAIVCVPLKINEKSIGCITVYRKKASAFGEHDLLSLNIIASQAAEALEKTNLIRELQKQATYDQLTGIYNKKALVEHFEAQLDLSHRHEQSTSVIFLDIDNFKSFNDTHGHLLGDKLLSDFAKVLKTCCRKSDILGRFGGEEFVMIAAQTGKKDACALCNNLREAVKKCKFIGSSNSKVAVTFSAGIASFPEDGDDACELLKKADDAMYKSKTGGRDMITLCETSDGKGARLMT